MRARKLSIALFVMAVVTLVAITTIPWKSLLEKRVLSMLTSRGFGNVSFHIQDIGIQDVSLTDIVIGKENPISLQSAKVEYSLRELLSGNLRDITLSGLNLKIIETNKGWVFTGMDAIPSRDPNIPKRKTDISAILKGLPFSTLTIKDSTLEIAGPTIQGIIPISLEISSSITLKTDPATMTAGSQIIDFGMMQANLKPDNTGLSGQWSLESILMEGNEYIPPLSGGGEISMTGSAINFSGSLKNDNNTHNAALTTQWDIDDSSKNKLILTQASLPFKGGRVSVRDVTLNMPLRLNVSIQKISVGELMQSLTGKRVSATGSLSGSVPLTIGRDGSYTIGQGSLKADKQGTIQMPPGTLPGNNEQVALVTQILENFHYSLLSAGVKSAKDGKITVQLCLEGNNPAVENGRIVKLNVNLTGDVLDFIQQNIMLFQTPEKLLEQGQQ